MKENAIEKINTMGKIANIIALIANIIIIIGLVLCIGGAIAVAALPDNLVTFSASGTGNVDLNLDTVGITLTESDQKSATNNFSNGNSVTFTYGGLSIPFSNIEADANGYHIKSTGVLANYSLHSLLAPLLTGIIYLTMTFIAIIFIKRLCKALKFCKSPFDENVISKMKAFGFSLIPWAIISCFSISINGAASNFDLNLNFSLNLSMIIAVLVIFVLVYIFQYGASLQQESYPTL